MNDKQLTAEFAKGYQKYWDRKWLPTPKKAFPGQEFTT